MSPLLLPLNLHLPVDDKPAFALIDESLMLEARKSRWLTGSDTRPLRSIYDPELMRSCPQALSRWVWHATSLLFTTEPSPRWIGHLNHDILDCRRTNLYSLPAPRVARSGRTGLEVGAVLASLSLTARGAREAMGLSVDGVAGRRGRAAPIPEEQALQLLQARRDVAQTLTLPQFNEQVVADICGRTLHPLLLSKILHGNVCNIKDFDYSSVPPFRRPSNKV